MAWEQQLELFFSQSLDGFFFMMLDEPLPWNDGIDKEAALDYAFTHQRLTRANDAMLAQYNTTRADFLGLTPADLYQHNVEYGRSLWRELFDRGRLHVETEERKLDGTPVWIEGDYICLHDDEHRITGHFGIQREVTRRKMADAAMGRFNRRLQVLQETTRAILALDSPQEIAATTVKRLHELLPCVRASVAVFDTAYESATLIAMHSDQQTQLNVGARAPVALFGNTADLHRGRVHESGDNFSADTAGPLEVLRAEGIRSFINVPLLAKGELIEVLNAAAREARVFTPEHIEIAQEFANTLALAMQQARLCREIEKHAAALEERVAQRTAELRESENRLRAVVTALPDLVFVVDEDGRYVEILTDDEQLLYRSSAELKGRTFSEVFPPELARQFEEVVRGTVQTERSGTIEYQLTVPAGEKWFEARTAFLNKRIDGKRCVVLAARNITDGKRAEDLENQRTWLLEELRADHNWGDMVGTSRAMQSVFRSIQMVGPTESTVLLLGETGTGKELIARALHHASKRHDSLMVKVNCAALPANLVESELFGHEKGAFTGATAQRRGRFEAAQNGTLFLDEVGELPPEVQVKLLRVLQEHEFERVGGSQTIKANARIIAATNRDLYREVQEGRFRADLFYRLNIFPIQVPPLRERREDIPLLARSFVAKFSGRLGKRIDGVSESTMQRLMNYDWPGNVRELENILERATILCGGPVLRDEHVGSLQLSESAKDGFTPLLELERQHIRKALDATGGVLAGDRGAARLLGLNRSTLWSRMQKLGISKPSE